MTAPTIAPAYAGPQSQPQLAPYGFFGDLISSVAPTVGGWIGGQTGQQVGTVASHLARYLPFSAGPQTPPVPQPVQQGQLAPYGFFGNLVSQVAPQIGQWAAGQTGQEIGQLAGNLAQRYLPFSAGPQMAQPQLAPYGFFGDLINQVAPQIGQWAAGQTGQEIGQLAGNLAQRYLPFSAGPQMAQPQLAPYGFFGDLINQVAPQIGQWAAGQTGQEIGQLAGNLAQRYLPFSAGPQLPQAQQPQLTPYGILGGALGNVLGGLGGAALGGWLGNRSAGEAIGRAAGSVLGAIVPFGVGPAQLPYAAPVPQYGQIPYGR